VLSLVPCSPRLARADEPTPAQKVEKRVTDGLLTPLADYEANISRFSRARMPPRVRRVRVTQATPTVDAQGRPFMAFALDVKWGEEWHENDVVGCAYTNSGELFVKRGDDFRPAQILMGKPADPVANVCKAAPRA